MAKYNKEMISSEEVRIMLLEQRNDVFHQTLLRLENKIDALDKKFEAKIDALDKNFETKFADLDSKYHSLDSKFDRKFDSQNAKIDSHFRWTMGLLFGLYATGFATLIGAVGKVYHWF